MGELAEAIKVLEQIRDRQQDAPSDPWTTTLHLIDANKEYPFHFPAGVKKFLIHCRENGRPLRFSTRQGEAGTSGTPGQFTIKANTSLSEEDVNMIDKTIYFACSTADTTIEFILWS